MLTLRDFLSWTTAMTKYLHKHNAPTSQRALPAIGVLSANQSASVTNNRWAVTQPVSERYQYSAGCQPASQRALPVIGGLSVSQSAGVIGNRRAVSQPIQLSVTCNRWAVDRPVSGRYRLSVSQSAGVTSNRRAVSQPVSGRYTVIGRLSVSQSAGVTGNQRA
ncbi:hypothetical protein RRG08_053397, partial [Elysia crispata]